MLKTQNPLSKRKAGTLNIDVNNSKSSLVIRLERRLLAARLGSELNIAQQGAFAFGAKFSGIAHNIILPGIAKFGLFPFNGFSEFFKRYSAHEYILPKI